MDRYTKVKDIINSLPKDSQRVCPNKNKPCSCKGCVSILGIRDSEFTKWKNNLL